MVSEEGWTGEFALLSFYNGFRDNIYDWDDDRLLDALRDMQAAMRMLKIRGVE